MSSTQEAQSSSQESQALLFGIDPKLVVFAVAIVVTIFTSVIYLAFSNLRRDQMNELLSRQQNALADIFLRELEQDIVVLISEMNLSSISEPQRQKLAAIKTQVDSFDEMIKQRAKFDEIDALMKALTIILIENNPAEAIPILLPLDSPDKAEATRSLALVLLGLSYHAKKDREEGGQSYSRAAEEYFLRATKLEFKVGLSFNGIAVQKALKGFDNLYQNSVDEALLLFREAERNFEKASDFDGTLASHYKYLNNTTTIRAFLLRAFLEEIIDEGRLERYFYGETLDDFVDEIDRGHEQADRFAHGSPGASLTAAECWSITGQYYRAVAMDDAEAKRRFSKGKSELMKAIDKGLFRKRSREEVEARLKNNGLLKPMLDFESNRKDLLSYAVD